MNFRFKWYKVILSIQKSTVKYFLIILKNRENLYLDIEIFVNFSLLKLIYVIQFNLIICIKLREKNKCFIN